MTNKIVGGIQIPTGPPWWRARVPPATIEPITREGFARLREKIEAYMYSDARIEDMRRRQRDMGLIE